METNIQNIPCIPGYTWDDVKWLGDMGYKNYYLTRDGKVWNEKGQRWVKADKFGGLHLSYEPNKFRHECTFKLQSKFFAVDEMLKQGYKYVANGKLLINKEGNVYDVELCRFLTPTLNNRGYYAVGHKYSSKLVHRLLAEAFIPNDAPEFKTWVNHKDNNGTNNSLDNLEWVTPSSNLRHAAQIGALSFAKLTYNDANEIRKLYSNGKFIRELAEMYGVSKSTIGAIVRGQNWDYAEDYHELDGWKSTHAVAKQLTSHEILPKKALSKKEVDKQFENVDVYLGPDDVNQTLTIDELIHSGYVEVLPGIYLDRRGWVYNTDLGRYHRLKYDNLGGDYNLKIKGHTYHLARLVAKAFVENDDPERKTRVTRLDNNNRNVNADNLVWTDSSMLIRRDTDYGKVGTVINKKIAREIRDLYSKGIKQADLSRHFKIAPDCVRLVLQGVTWNNDSRRENEK